jgi:predicted Zn finger-like uncharacterized protein
MSATILHCPNCDSKLRIRDAAPSGKLVRCPTCRRVFKAHSGGERPVAGRPPENDLNCSNCGATLSAEGHLRSGQLGRCPKCSTIFQIPSQNLGSAANSNLAKYFEAWTPRTKQEADEFRLGPADIVDLKPSTYGVQSGGPIEAEVVRPWEALPDEIRAERQRQQRAKRARSRTALRGVAMIVALTAAASVIVIVLSRTRRASSPSETESATAVARTQAVAPRRVAEVGRELSSQAHKPTTSGDSENSLPSSESGPNRDAQGMTRSQPPLAGGQGANERAGSNSGDRGPHGRVRGASAGLVLPQPGQQPQGADGKMRLRWCSGFMVAAGGYILTNAEMARDPTAILVRIAGCADSPSAQVIAVDTEHDLALLRIRVPKETGWQPLPLSPIDVREGESVASLSYRTSDPADERPRLAVGKITAEAHDGPFGSFHYDSPGNRAAGAPILDTYGNAVGMALASGAALPARDLIRFLKEHIENYQEADIRSEARDWNEIEEINRSSIVIVLGRP